MRAAAGGHGCVRVKIIIIIRLAVSCTKLLATETLVSRTVYTRNTRTCRAQQHQTLLGRLAVCTHRYCLFIFIKIKMYQRIACYNKLVIYNNLVTKI